MAKPRSRIVAVEARCSVPIRATGAELEEKRAQASNGSYQSYQSYQLPSASAVGTGQPVG